MPHVEAYIGRPWYMLKHTRAGSGAHSLTQISSSTPTLSLQYLALMSKLPSTLELSGKTMQGEPCCERDEVGVVSVDKMEGGETIDERR